MVVVPGAIAAAFRTKVLMEGLLRRVYTVPSELPVLGHPLGPPLTTPIWTKCEEDGGGGVVVVGGGGEGGEWWSWRWGRRGGISPTTAPMMMMVVVMVMVVVRGRQPLRRSGQCRASHPYEQRRAAVAQTGVPTAHDPRAQLQGTVTAAGGVVKHRERGLHQHGRAAAARGRDAPSGGNGALTGGVQAALPLPIKTMG